MDVAKYLRSAAIISPAFVFSVSDLFVVLERHRFGVELFNQLFDFVRHQLSQDFARCLISRWVVQLLAIFSDQLLVYPAADLDIYLASRFVCLNCVFGSISLLRVILEIFEILGLEVSAGDIFDDVIFCVGIVVADVSFAAGSLARCVLCFGSWRQQRFRGFQQESAIEFRNVDECFALFVWLLVVNAGQPSCSARRVRRRLVSARSFSRMAFTRVFGISRSVIVTQYKETQVLQLVVGSTQLAVPQEVASVSQ
ncbi:RNase Z-like protein [Dorcoceras hygrometricum]|uniref:RNase Z-like protein n=1 Tax=Dorcoceras hygrometricum TaxID=472368 RepID=A0A2Z7CGI5_9LAMI|nr:RNase Z-like protein [Dorcoceras hygrometricum]